jgi:predicted PurR-regulated permease PerM
MLRKIDISHRTIIFTVLFLLGLWLLYSIRGILLMLFVAFLLTTILEPLVELLMKIKIRRSFAVAISFVLVIGVFGGVIALIAPVLIQETISFVSALPVYLSNIGVDISATNNLLGSLVQQIGGVLNFTFSVFSNVFSIITVLVFTFYMLMSYTAMKDQITLLLGEERGQRIYRLVLSIEEKLGKWSRGQLILMLSVAVGNYLGYLLLGIPFALPLAVLTGIFEIVPTLGPIVSAIPAVLIGFGISPLVGVGAAVVAFVVNQLENYILVPKIMQKSAGVSPLLVLLSVAIGVKVAGIMGALIAVPFVVMLQVILREYFSDKAKPSEV